MKAKTIVEFALEYVRPGEFVELDADQVRSRLGEPGFHVFDARLEAPFERAHVPGAVHVGMEGVTAEVLPEDHDATLVFYCGSEMCMASHVAATRAKELGYRNVTIMPEGAKGWAERGHATEQGDASTLTPASVSERAAS